MLARPNKGGAQHLGEVRVRVSEPDFFTVSLWACSRPLCPAAPAVEELPPTGINALLAMKWRINAGTISRGGIPWPVDEAVYWFIRWCAGSPDAPFWPRGRADRIGGSRGYEGAGYAELLGATGAGVLRVPAAETALTLNASSTPLRAGWFQSAAGAWPHGLGTFRTGFAVPWDCSCSGGLAVRAGPGAEAAAGDPSRTETCWFRSRMNRENRSRARRSRPAGLRALGEGKDHRLRWRHLCMGRRLKRGPIGR